MSRPLRIEYDGAWYHVMNRGAGRRRIFRSPNHEAQFLDVLDDVARTFDFEVHAFCLMANHYHLLVHTPLAGLGRAMRHLDGIYAQRYNRCTGTDGPLFRGRYRAVLVCHDSHLCQVSRYIHLNPVQAGIAARAEDWPASSYRAFLGLCEAPRWLQLEPTLRRFSPGNVRLAYRRFVEAGLDDDTRRFFARQRIEPVLGPDGFRDRIAGLVRTAGSWPDPEIPDLRRIAARPSFARIAGAVCDVFGIPVIELRRIRARHEGHSLARGVVVGLGREVGGLSFGQIAEWLGYASHAAASKAMARMRARLREDRSLRERVDLARTALAGAGRDPAWRCQVKT